MSWSYILRNDMVMLLLRKSPLSGLVGSARLSAECLWTHSARGALDRLRAVPCGVPLTQADREQH